MEKTHRARLLPLYAFLSLLHLSIATAFSPIDHHLINCGSTEATAVDNRRFTADSDFVFPSGTITPRDPNPKTPPSSIYETARVFSKPSKYSFRIRDKGTHLVRLHFRGFNSVNFKLDDVQFHVSANGFVLLSNFSPKDTLIVKDYMIWGDSDEIFEIATEPFEPRITLALL